MGAQTMDENRQFYKIQNELFEKCMHTTYTSEIKLYRAHRKDERGGFLQSKFYMHEI